jgi:hypothetical protein
MANDDFIQQSYRFHFVQCFFFCDSDEKFQNKSNALNNTSKLSGVRLLNVWVYVCDKYRYALSSVSDNDLLKSTKTKIHNLSKMKQWLSKIVTLGQPNWHHQHGESFNRDDLILAMPTYSAKCL